MSTNWARRHQTSLYFLWSKTCCWLLLVLFPDWYTMYTIDKLVDLKMFISSSTKSSLQTPPGIDHLAWAVLTHSRMIFPSKTLEAGFSITMMIDETGGYWVFAACWLISPKIKENRGYRYSILRLHHGFRQSHRFKTAIWLLFGGCPWRWSTDMGVS